MRHQAYLYLLQSGISILWPVSHAFSQLLESILLWLQPFRRGHQLIGHLAFGGQRFFQQLHTFTHNYRHPVEAKRTIMQVRKRKQCPVQTYQMQELLVENKQEIKQDPAEIFLLTSCLFLKGRFHKGSCYTVCFFRILAIYTKNLTGEVWFISCDFQKFYYFTSEWISAIVYDTKSAHSNWNMNPRHSYVT